MTKKRLELLEARHSIRVSAVERRAIQPDTLHELARRVCLALPEDLQATVEADGARGYAALLEAWWEVGAGEVTPQTALEAYLLAFEGGTA
ncbi:hypothetical protein [Deinococcus sp. QL22]|uniref:hypothetical protein n=1 Tax=Deinococcus sp. QL22 TaxID=2939437 RepID=UPI002016FC72|nr:hypothetical protein [Deinococcus sp. QL22]UQN04974.1 hypothetical protein M1R55_08610 [Deinococcus sp. QL22]